MLTLNIGKGFFDVINGHQKLHVRFTLESMSGYGWERDPVKDKPPISEVYELCQKVGMTGEQTIDYLLKVYHKNRIFRIGHLAKLPLIIGFVGPRGSGKSVGATMVTIVDYLLCGYRVWSNMPIEVRVVYKDAEKIFRSEDVDKMDLLNMGDKSYEHGLIFIDELNVTLSEARRSMSTLNLQFNYAIQQIRKRDLSVMVSLQNEMFTDSVFRWQSDIWVKCSDCYFTHDAGAECVGDKSHWIVYDTSGITGLVREEGRYTCVIGKAVCWNRPWWGAYNTKLVQTRDANMGRDLKAAAKASMIEERESEADRIASAILSQGLVRVDTRALWQHMDINDRTMQIAVGMKLAERGVVRRRGTGGEYFYEFPEN